MSARATVIAAPSGTYRADFLQWLADNYAVWMRFHDEANAMRLHGRKHYSARTIAEYLRHDTALSQRGDLKLDNNVVPDLARLYMALHPEAKGFFSMRVR